MSHYIGIYDPETQDLQLVQARKATIRGTPRSETGNESAKEEEPAPNVTLRYLSRQLHVQAITLLF